MTSKSARPSNFIYRPKEDSSEFIMTIAREEEVTIDGRMFEKDAIDWREPPLPLMVTRVNGDGGGHKGSIAAGSIVDIWRDGNTIYGRGYFGSDEESQQAKQWIDEGIISGVSADVGGAISQEFADDRGDGVRKLLSKGTIIAVTALPMPSFNSTPIAVTAAMTPENWQPPAEWFKPMQLDGPTPLTVTADGRVYGHAAVWGTCHIGYKDRCVTPPRSKSGYQYFNTGTVLTADGSTATVGRLTAGTGHARIEFGAQPAVQHYDDNGWGAAYVHATEDEFGIVYSGAVAPTADDNQMTQLRAGAVSGDWRTINNGLEMVGLLAVNMPGFPVPRASAGMVAGAQMSLVAAGMVTVESLEADCGCSGNSESLEVEVPEITELSDEQVETEGVSALAEADLAFMDFMAGKMYKKSETHTMPDGKKMKGAKHEDEDEDEDGEEEMMMKKKKKSMASDAYAVLQERKSSARYDKFRG
jgi:hypothetical protein